MAFTEIITGWIYAFPFEPVIDGVASSAVAQLTLSHAINFQLLLTPLVAWLAGCYFSFLAPRGALGGEIKWAGFVRVRTRGY